jgi:molybdopterin/thiamine biosynthesis adenylyltransferase
LTPPRGTAKDLPCPAAIDPYTMDNAPLFELIVPFAAWRQAVVPLLSNPQLVATGLLVRDSRRQPAGLLSGELTASGPAPTGAAFPPLADWVAVAAPADAAHADPAEWLRRLQPRFSQLLAVLLVGLGRERSGWRGWTVERGVLRPLAGLRIVGPGMVHAQTAVPVDPLADTDPARWTRLRGAAGEAAFARLRQAEAAVVGCSRTGTLAAGMLAALGVRGLVLIDGDAVEPHNLDGMVFATEADLGENKAVALGQRLVAFRPDLRVKAVRRPLDAVTAEGALAGIDLVVTCVDEDGARLRAAHRAREQLTPHLDIGTGVTRTAGGGRQLAADVRLLLPGAGCVRCVGGLGDSEQAEYEFRAPPGALPRRTPEAWDARGRLGSLVTLNSMAVGLGVQSWLDLLDGSLAGSIWHRLRWRPGHGLEVNAALVGAGAGCPLCRL